MVRSHYIKSTRFSHVTLELWAREVGATVLRYVRLRSRVRVFFTGGNKPQRKVKHA
jgi:hypothetical protein